MSDRPIQITEFDLVRLQKLLEEIRRSGRETEYLTKLQGELDRAEVVTPQNVPQEVITMNSTVVLLDLASGQEETYTLVFPEDADAAAGRISVLAPVGTAMLGYRVGDVFEWKVPAGERRLQVKSILYQPEAAGDFDR